MRAPGQVQDIVVEREFARGYSGTLYIDGKYLVFVNGKLEKIRSNISAEPEADPVYYGVNLVLGGDMELGTSYAPIMWSSPAWHSGGCWDSDYPERLYAPEDGIYIFSIFMHLEDPGADEPVLLRVLDKDDNELYNITNAIITEHTEHFAFRVQMSSGDWIYTEAKCTSSSRTLYGTSLCWFQKVA